jgi:hypothetical protein
MEVASRVEELLSAIRLANAGEHTRDNGSQSPGRASCFLALDWSAQELLVTAEDTAVCCISYNPSMCCSNARTLKKLVEIGLDAAARLPIIDGPCGCHPP